MKGLVFTEFLDLVDETFGENITEDIIGACPLKSHGSYTGVGTYDAEELHLLVGALSGSTGISADELQRLYGQKLFGRFQVHNSRPFEQYKDAFTFLEHVGTTIHDEVRGLYPDAALPNISTERVSSRTMVLHYQSERNLASFCRGLIEGCLKHFRQAGTVTESINCDETPAIHTFTIDLIEA